MNDPSAGFSILEAAVALLIVGLIAVSFMATTGAQLDGVVRAEESVNAAALADEMLARVIAGGVALIPDSLARGTFPPPFDRYRWTARSEEDRRVRGLFEVTIIVEWRGRSFELRSRTFQKP